jgi:hypothetical protein
MTELGFPRRLRGAALTNKNNRRLCPQCEGIDAAAHPLAVGAIVTVLRFQSGGLVAEGIGTIIRPASERDVYFIRFRGEAGIQKRLIFPDYQHDTTRAIEIVTRHLANASRLASAAPESAARTTGGAA